MDNFKNTANLKGVSPNGLVVIGLEKNRPTTTLPSFYLKGQRELAIMPKLWRLARDHLERALPYLQSHLAEPKRFRHCG